MQRLLQRIGGFIVLGAIATHLGSCRPNIPTALADTALDQGDLQINYTEPENPDHQEVYEILETDRFYDNLVADLNASFALPQDIPIVFRSCDEDNAWYDPEVVEITLCYELIKNYADIAHEMYQEDYATEVMYAGFFTFYHELGHALVDQYDLPITGQEEDAVDEFAAILLIENEEYDAVIAAVDQFDADAIAEYESDEDYYLWDEHSLSDQRFYNTACLIYGSDPEGFRDWVADDFLPAARAELCEAEYQQAQASWDRLLADYRL